MLINEILPLLARIFDHLFSTPLKLSYISVLTPSVIVMITAALSARNLGGELGNGLKKIAAGTIIYVIVYITIIVKEIMPFETMTAMQMRFFFIFSNLLGSVLLIFGFRQMYKVSSRLKLF